MSLSKRARVAAGLAATTATFGLSFASAPPASADVCAQAGVTVNGSTPQRQGPCVVLLSHWNWCHHPWGQVGPVRHDAYACVILPDV